MRIQVIGTIIIVICIRYNNDFKLGGLTMENAIVIGAFNFVGFKLCCRLLEEGIVVYGVDTPESREDEFVEEKQLQIGRNANFSWQEVSECVFFDNKGSNCYDTVYYCLFDPSINMFSKGIDKCMNQTTKLLKEVIQYCNEYKIKLVLLSTIEVLGNQTVEMNDDTIPAPESDSGRLHLIEENLVKSETEKFNVNYVICRVPTIYGPWQPTHMMYQQLIIAVMNKQEPKLEINENTRDIIYVDDVVDALINLAMPQFEKKSILLSSGKENQWYEGAKFLYERFPKEMVNTYHAPIPLPKATKLVNFKPKTSIKEGIEKQVQQAFWLNNHV